METIKDIIDKIQELEGEFDIFNLRILEFAKSTNLWDIDQKLLNKYISSINNYLNLIETFKTDISLITSDRDDYQAEKNLVLFRLEKLEKIFNNTLKKLNIINNTFLKNSYKDESIKDIGFESRDEMLEINKNLYDFYNNYNKNLEFQKKYNIDISLNNDFETKKENELSSIELTKIENIYILELNNIFEDLEKLEMDFSILFNKAININKIFFSNFNDQYFPENDKSFIDKKIEKNLLKKYINDDFNVVSSKFWKDFSNFKQIIITEYENLETLINVNLSIKNYEDFLLLNKDYNLFTDLDFFQEKYNNFNELLIKTFNDSSQAIGIVETDSKFNNIKNIKLINEIFLNSLELLKNYDLIFKIYSEKLNFWFKSNLFTIFNVSNIADKYIKEWLSNIRENLNKELNNINLEINDKYFLENYSQIILKYNKYLIDAKDSITSLETYISNNIVYNNGSLKTYSTNIYSKLEKLENSLFINNDSLIKLSFKNYLLETIQSLYETSKNNYYYSQNSAWRSWSSWSSSSGWSSGWSSFSSSYSSSGSSHW